MTQPSLEAAAGEDRGSALWKAYQELQTVTTPLALQRGVTLLSRAPAMRVKGHLRGQALPPVRVKMMTIMILIPLAVISVVRRVAGLVKGRFS
jgi:hypothetical protein